MKPTLDDIKRRLPHDACCDSQHEGEECNCPRRDLIASLDELAGLLYSNLQWHVRGPMSMPEDDVLRLKRILKAAEEDAT